MDGNGRWAKKKGLKRLRGHAAGRDSVRAITEYCAEIGVRYLSLFAFSEENWGRPMDEIQGLMDLLAQCMLEERDTLLKNNIRLQVIGDRSRLSEKLLKGIKALEEESAGNTRMTMIIMLSYSGKWDILQAARKLAASGKDPEKITMEDMDSALVTAGVPDPELLIRTSGEQRISNYMLWQTAYTEFVFTDTLWPDFRKDSLVAAIEEYSRRDRRFGKVK